MKGNAEGTYKTKHAEAARLYYTTTYIYTLLCYYIYQVIVRAWVIVIVKGRPRRQMLL